MAQTIAELVVQISAENASLKKSLNESVTATETSFQKISKSVASAGLAVGAFGAILKGIEFNKMAESAETAFTVMLGSASDAKDMLAELKDFANKTPLEFADIRDASQTLLQFGINGDDVLNTIKMLGDVSGGNSEKLKSLAIVFGQIQSTGHLMGQDLLQLINVGFNPLKEISERTGESMESLKKKMEKGAISAEMVTESFKKATSEGGLFFGMLDKQSGTLTGKMSTLADATDTFLGSMTESLTGPLKSGVDVLTNLLNVMTQIPGPIKAAIIVAGGLGAALLAVTTAAGALGIALPAAFGPVGLVIAGVAASIVAITAGMSEMQKYRYDTVTGQFVLMADAMGKSADQMKIIADGADRAQSMFQLMANGGNIVREDVEEIAKELGLSVVEFAKIIDSSKVIDTTQKKILHSILTQKELNDLAYAAQYKTTSSQAELAKKREENEKKAADAKAKADAENLKRLEEQRKKEEELAKQREKDAKDWADMQDRAFSAAVDAIEYEKKIRSDQQAKELSDFQELAREEANNRALKKDALEKYNDAQEEAHKNLLALIAEEQAARKKALADASDIASGIASTFATVGGEGAKTLSSLGTLASGIIKLIASEGSDAASWFTVINGIIDLAFKNNKDGADAFNASLDASVSKLMDGIAPALTSIMNILQTLLPIIDLIAVSLKPITPLLEGVATITGWIADAFSMISAIISGDKDSISAKWDAFTKSITDFFEGKAGTLIAAILTGGGSLTVDSNVVGGTPLVNTGNSDVNTLLDILLGIGTAGATTVLNWIGDATGWFASGTDFAPGGMAVVGEQGPELVNLPRGSQVVPNKDLNNSVGQGTVVNIYSPKAVDPSEASYIMRETFREMAFAGAV